MKTIVFYHRADMDGIFCREVARKFLPDATLIGWDYSDPAPSIPPDIYSTVYVVDLSIPNLMDDPRLIWVDHHASAIAKYSSDIKGYRVDGVAACRLLYQWFCDNYPSYEEYRDRQVQEPLALRMVGEYDVWDHRDPAVLTLQAGLYYEPDKTDYASLLKIGYSPELDRLLVVGEILRKAKATENASIIKNHGFELEWEGVKFLACNHARFNSLLFESELKLHHQAVLGFKWNGKNRRWVFSLYSCRNTPKDLDLSAIAVKYGGGGHRGACGFDLDHIPFKLG